ncbi:peptide chain release factor H [Clostridium sediminicola]|uniref:peptide chain release factor H n=1 Tax=Clostridium sediminicola TaxID=3114879 RepID=UPI0031F2047D
MWLQISAGQAPVECCRFVFLFLRKLKKECQKENIKVELLDYTQGEKKDTIKSVFLRLSGKCAESYASSIEGTLQWICQSPYRKNHKRKNWFIEVEVYEEKKSLDLDLKQIKIETMRCSGNGGQNVNKLETGVKITHLPSGIVAKSQEERSQLQNKKIAMIRLHKKLEEINDNKILEMNKSRWGKHQDIKRGDPIRVFKGIEFKETKQKTK